MTVYGNQENSDRKSFAISGYFQLGNVIMGADSGMGIKKKELPKQLLSKPVLYNSIQQLIALKYTAGMFVNGFWAPAIIKNPTTTDVVTGLFLTLTLFGPVFRIPMPIQIKKPTLWVSFLIWSPSRAFIRTTTGSYKKVWSEYRDSNPRPLGPEIAKWQKSISNASIMYDTSRNQRFSKLTCPTCPYGTNPLWVTVWVRRNYRSAKVGVFVTFEISLNRLDFSPV